ncbi:MAG: hypothetical protein [Caudoviricetes sp.]|nr:MAG: hypothetical protein [Caudoviricetes sp.]
MSKEDKVQLDNSQFFNIRLHIPKRLNGNSYTFKNFPDYSFNKFPFLYVNSGTLKSSVINSPVKEQESLVLYFDNSSEPLGKLYMIIYNYYSPEMDQNINTGNDIYLNLLLIPDLSGTIIDPI